MNIEKAIAALRAEGRTLHKKITETPEDFTPEDEARSEAIVKEIERLEGLKAKSEALAGFAQEAPAVEDEETEQKKLTVGKSLGERFVDSAAYKSFRQDVGGREIQKGQLINVAAKSLVSKADPLTTVLAGNARAVRTNEVDDLVYRPERTLLDVVTTGTTDLPWVQYRQITEKISNAAIVAEAKTTTGTDAAGGLKPISSLVTTTAEAKVATYADGMEVTNQELQDDGIMRALIDSTLRENLEIEIERVLLSGSGTGDEPRGLLNTTGVKQIDFTVDAPTTIRKGITALRKISTNIRGVLLNPEDDEAWDLLKDTNGRFLGNGPFGTGPGTAWGYERIVSQAIPVGTAILGDFSTIHLLTKDPLEILAFNQHKDYAQRNLTYVRAELRAMQMFRAPAKLAILDLTA